LKKISLWPRDNVSAGPAVALGGPEGNIYNAPKMAASA